MFSSYYMGLTGHIYPNKMNETDVPVVVINPEDREQTNRVADAFCLERWSHVEGSDECDPLTRTAMQAALREFANPTPPKPDEPTGLGAVVEDSQGETWVRVDRIALANMHWRRAGSTYLAKWQAINAVRVLSEGVQP